MSRMSAATDRWTRMLNVTVVVIVLLDLSIMASYLLSWPPNWWERLHVFAPYLVLASAVLPAAAAGISGIRFQSECRRLADRSLVMRRLLEQSDQRCPNIGGEYSRAAARSGHRPWQLDPGCFATGRDNCTRAGRGTVRMVSYLFERNFPAVNLSRNVQDRCAQ